MKGPAAVYPAALRFGMHDILRLRSIDLPHSPGVDIGRTVLIQGPHTSPETSM